jgi:hypothetical protein
MGVVSLRLGDRDLDAERVTRPLDLAECLHELACLAAVRKLRPLVDARCVMNLLCGLC